MESDVLAAIRTCRECSRTTRIPGTDLRGRRTHQNISENAWSTRGRKHHQEELEPSWAIRDVKRTHREHQGASRMSESGCRSCKTHQNASGNAQREKVETTHLGGLQRSQRTRAVKRSCQVVSTTSRKVLGRSETSASMERMHHVDIETQKGAWTCRWSREVSRSIGTAIRLSRVLDAMRNIPGVTGASAAPERMHHVEITGQEAIWASKSGWEMSTTI